MNRVWWLFILMGFSPAWAQQAVETDTLKESWPLNGARALIIDLPAGKLTLTAGQGDAIGVQGRVRNPAFLRHGQAGGVFRLYWQAPLARPPEDLDLQLSVPALEHLRIHGLRLEVAARGVQSQQVRVGVNQLDIHGELASPRLRLEAMQGRVQLRLSDNRVTALSLLNGTVSLEGLSGRARVRVLNGQISLQGTAMEDVRLHNQNGGMELQVDLLDQARVEAQTLTGSIQVQLSDGPYHCRFETLTGQVHVNDTPLPAESRNGSGQHIDCSPPDTPATAPRLRFVSQTGNLIVNQKPYER